MINIVGLFELRVTEYHDGTGRIDRYDYEGPDERFGGSAEITALQLEALKKAIPETPMKFEVMTYGNPDETA
jgi:hypothetical protein